VPVSPTAEVAADQLRQQAGDTLEAILEETARLLRRVSDNLSRHSVPDALSAVGGEPRLGQWAGEAAAVAKGLIEWVLGRLVRLLPAGHLDELKKKVSDLLTATDLHDVVAVALGVRETSKRIEGWLSAPGLDLADLDGGTADLMKLEHRYTRQMCWAHRGRTPERRPPPQRQASRKAMPGRQHTQNPTCHHLPCPTDTFPGNRGGP